MSKRKRDRVDVQDTDVFAASLDALTPEDISDSNDAQSGHTFSDIIRKAVLCLCAAVFVYSASIMINQLSLKIRANDSYDNIRDIFYDDSGIARDGALLQSAPMSANSTIGGDTYQGGEGDSLDEHFLVKSKLIALKSINPDIYGWIKIEGTQIDYPVVQGVDNDYYLNRTFEGEYMNSGTLFVDFNNSKKLDENRNTVIYGHNMSDGSMFHTLYNFKDSNFFKNGVVELVTQDGIYKYEIFSAHVVHETDPYFVTSFENDEAFLSFAETMQSQSVYTKNLKFTSEDRILTLSTCTNIRDDERFAVHARLIEE